MFSSPACVLDKQSNPLHEIKAGFGRKVKNAAV